MKRIILAVVALAMLSGCTAVNDFLEGPAILRDGNTKSCYVHRGYTTHDGSSTSYSVNCY